MNQSTNQLHHPDVLLIGAGIMSATLGILLKTLDPGLRIVILERLDEAAAESSAAWNNAGTGHSAFCELNYTPEDEDGKVDISKALKICESFEVSKQLWAFLVRAGRIAHPEGFLRQVPHIAYVWGAKDVAFLRKRYEAMTASPLFFGMEYTEDSLEMKGWMPLCLPGLPPAPAGGGGGLRQPAVAVREHEGPSVQPSGEPTGIPATPTNNATNAGANGSPAPAESGGQAGAFAAERAATKMDIGTDVNFGDLTRAMLADLCASGDVQIHYGAEVRTLAKDDENHWYLEVKDVHTGDRSSFVSKFVFIGAGGGSLPLLLKSGIPEGRHYGGFPVSGQWLRCTKPAVIALHDAKVYGKAAVGAPPMSVPHLDTRFIEGEQALLFGPYAGFSTRFLKNGSLADLPRSLRWSNLKPMIMAGLHNIPLTKYLVQQVVQGSDDRLEALRQFVPDAKAEDWELLTAGQRVQVIKKDDEEGGVLEFGTEVVSAADGSLAALLGASPGASTAVSIMLSLIEKCFPHRIAEWTPKLQEMIPSYGKSLAEDEALLQKVRAESGAALGLQAGR